MNLYLDEDSADPHLIGLLRAFGHDVVVPVDVAMLAASDPRQLLFAVQQHRVLLSRNDRDFKDLHDLLVGCGGSHPGLLTVREEKNRKRDMKPAQIARAIGRLVAAGVPLADQHYILNHWR